MSNTLRITRQQLAKFLGNDHDAIRQFETLFSTVADSDSTAVAAEPEIAVEVVAHEALARIERLERAFQMLEMAPTLSVDRVEGLQGQLDGKMSSASTYIFFDPDKPPTSPTSQDDEFESATIDGKWTLINFGSASAYDANTTVPGCLYIRQSNTSRILIAAMQTIPSGDFTIVTKVSSANQQTGTQDANCGLLLADGASGGSGSQTILASTQANQAWITSWTKYNTIGTSVALMYERLLRYLRIRRSGSNYYWGSSEDGKTWAEYSWNPAYTPTHFGIYSYCYQSGAIHNSFEFFRYFNSASAVLGGSRTVYTG